MSDFFNNLYSTDSNMILYIYLGLAVLIIITIFFLVMFSIKPKKEKKEIPENKLDKKKIEQTIKMPSISKILPKKEDKNANVKKLEITQEILREDLRVDASFSPVYLEPKDITPASVIKEEPIMDTPDLIAPPTLDIEPIKEEPKDSIYDELLPEIIAPPIMQEELIYDEPEIEEPVMEMTEQLGLDEAQLTIEEEIKEPEIEIPVPITPEPEIVIDWPEFEEEPEMEEVHISEVIIEEEPEIELPKLTPEPEIDIKWPTFEEEPEEEIDLSIDVLKASVAPVIEEEPVLEEIIEEPVMEINWPKFEEEPIKEEVIEIPPVRLPEIKDEKPQVTADDLKSRLAMLQEKTQNKDPELNNIIEEVVLAEEPPKFEEKRYMSR